MLTIIEIRHQNLELVLASFPAAVDLANRAGMSPSYLSQLTTKDKSGKQRRNLGEKLARKFELALGLPVGWMDTPQESFVLGAAALPAPARPGASHPPRPVARASGIQNALVETAQRLVAAGLLSDLDCLALLQGWQPLIAKLNETSATS